MVDYELPYHRLNWRGRSLRTKLETIRRAVLLPITISLILTTEFITYRLEQIRLDRDWKRQWPVPPLKGKPIRTAVAASSDIGLFGRLPHELRLEIYKILLHNREQIHLRHAHNSLTNSRSEANNLPWPVFSDLYEIVPFLQSCRAIYTETTEILYGQGRFHIDGFDRIKTFVCLSHTIAPAHLALISHLQVAVPVCEYITMNVKGMDDGKRRLLYPRGPRWVRDRHEPWKQLWAIIARRMPGLKDLYLTLTLGEHINGFERRPLAMDIKEAWVQPLLQVRGRLRSFYLAFHADSSDMEEAAMFGPRIQDLAQFKAEMADLKGNLQRVMCAE